MAVRDETDKLQATILFSLYDTNKDGVLDEEEFANGLELLGLKGLTDDEIKASFRY